MSDGLDPAPLPEGLGIAAADRLGTLRHLVPAVRTLSTTQAKSHGVTFLWLSNYDADRDA